MSISSFDDEDLYYEKYLNEIFKKKSIKKIKKIFNKYPDIKSYDENLVNISICISHDYFKLLEYMLKNCKNMDILFYFSFEIIHYFIKSNLNKKIFNFIKKNKKYMIIQFVYFDYFNLDNYIFFYLDILIDIKNTKYFKYILNIYKTNLKKNKYNIHNNLSKHELFYHFVSIYRPYHKEFHYKMKYKKFSNINFKNKYLKENYLKEKEIKKITLEYYSKLSEIYKND